MELVNSAQQAVEHFAELFPRDKRWHWWYTYTTVLVESREPRGLEWLAKQISILDRVLKSNLLPGRDIDHARNILNYMKTVLEG